MKCIITYCQDEATRPFHTCDKKHGMIWKKIQDHIKHPDQFEAPNWWLDNPLSKEDIEYYKKFI